MQTRTIRILLVALMAATAMIAVQPAAAAHSAKCSTDDPYTLTAGALTGAQATELALAFTAAPGCDPVTVIDQLRVKTFREDDRQATVRDLYDVAVENGALSIPLDRVARGRRIEARATVRTGTPERVYVVRGDATSLLRPDLAVASVQAPQQTLTTRPVDVAAEIAERNGDTAATAEVSLAGPIGPLADPVQVTVPAGGHVSVTFRGVALTTAATTDLRVLVTDAAPAEYDATNDDRGATVEVTKNELVPDRLLVPSLGGYGFQFNGHLYAPITGAAPETLPDLESKVKALEPQLVRVFYNENWEANADKTHPEWAQNLESFEKTVQLANESGASVVVAYQTAAVGKTAPATWMGRFADVLQDLVRTRGLTNVHWVTIQNEPNSTNVTLPQYEALYRALDAQLRTRGLRDQIRLMGGDLVEGNEANATSHRAWFDYMTTHMNDVLDAWSEHIYWNYWDHFRMEERLKDVSHLVDQELPASARKPTFIMEFGVRGANSCGSKPTVTAAYYQDADCTELRRMPLAAFQKLWFAIESAQLGFDGAACWDLYAATYDRTKNNQSYWTIGPAEEGWALYPSYYAFQLLLQTTARGWRVLGVDPWTVDDQATRYDDPHPDQLEQELTAYAGPDGQLTVAGLDTRGGSLAAPDGESSSYSVGGLPPNTAFTLAVWNADGDGHNSIAAHIVTNAAGVARFDVPLQAAFALTTVPVA